MMGVDSLCGVDLHRLPKSVLWALSQERQLATEGTKASVVQGLDLWRRTIYGNGGRADTNDEGDDDGDDDDVDDGSDGDSDHESDGEQKGVIEGEGGDMTRIDEDGGESAAVDSNGMGTEHLLSHKSGEEDVDSDGLGNQSFNTDVTHHHGSEANEKLSTSTNTHDFPPATVIPNIETAEAVEGEKGH